MKCLDDAVRACQWWCVTDEVTEGVTKTDDGLDVWWAKSSEFLFAVAAVPRPAAMARESQRAYEALLQTARTQARPHLLRIWNYLPGINQVDGGVERYRSFNRGRQQAYREFGYTIADGAPAACALGAAGGPLQVAILAGERPATAIDNPRQVSPHRYPEQYGAVPPVFSRAAWLPQAAGADLLFISGTASIVGHRTLHAGDAATQTEEAVRNIQAVLDEANGNAGGRPCRLSDLRGRVYVRHAADLPLIRDVLQGHGMTRLCYLEADICRSDLLVEIEAEGQYPHAD